MTEPKKKWLDGYAKAWIAWVAAFFVIEGAAVTGDTRRATLSNKVRDWLKQRKRWVQVAALLFMLLLTAHFTCNL